MQNTHLHNAAAAALHAEAYKSDPFAQRVMLHYLDKGLENAREVSKHARLIIEGRKAAIEAAFKAWKAAQ